MTDVQLTPYLTAHDCAAAIDFYEDAFGAVETGARFTDPEGRIGIQHQEVTGHYPDGERFSLRHPVYTILDPAFGPLDSNTMISPRIAQAVIGMGLLEAIPERRILDLAAEQRAMPEQSDMDM